MRACVHMCVCAFVCVCARASCVFWLRCFVRAAEEEGLANTIATQAFWQKSGNDRAFFLVGCVKKSRAERFGNAASAAKI